MIIRLWGKPDASLQYLSKSFVDHASIEVAFLECTSLDAIKQERKLLTAALTAIKSIEINRTTDEQPLLQNLSLEKEAYIFSCITV